MVLLKTLPYLVGRVIITTPEIVCQEKNAILEIFSAKIVLSRKSKWGKCDFVRARFILYEREELLDV
jgi:hypothetical protein